MKKVGVILILLTSLLGLCFCQKKLFKKIRIKGTVIDWYNHNPIPVKVNISAQRKSLKLEEFSIKDSESNNDGSFDIQTHAAVTGHYYLMFSSKYIESISNSHMGFHKELDIKDNSTMDFGEIQDMSHFFYCKATIIDSSHSGNYISYKSPSSGNYTDFPTNTNTVFIDLKAYNQGDFELNNHNYILAYWIKNNTKYPYVIGKVVSIPIVAGDTVSALIKY